MYHDTFDLIASVNINHLGTCFLMTNIGDGITLFALYVNQSIS